MESTLETFKLLRRLYEKRVRYRHHLSNYKTYRANNSVPKGLQIHVPTGLPLCDSGSYSNWKGILRKTSLKLMEVQIGNCRKTISELNQQIDSKTRKLKRELPKSELQNKLRHISQDCLRLSQSLNSRQQRKFQRDHITSNQVILTSNQVSPNSKKSRSRRFLRKPVTDSSTATDAVVTISCQLSEEETKLLSKGLNFCPKPRQTDTQKLSLDLAAFYRRLRLREHFADEDGVTQSLPDNEIVSKFKPKSTWNPPKGRCPPLESFISAIEEEVKTYTSAPDFRDNLTKSERQAIKNLRHRDDIVIKPADKGSAIVAMGTKFYREEAYRLLGNPDHYKRLHSDPTSEIAKKVEAAIQKMVRNGSIDSETGPNLLQVDPKPGRFYFLPKIHKTGNPGRPIISGNGTATEKISKFVDLLIQPLVPSLPSYVQDTTDFIRKIGEIQNLPQDTILATLDVSSLYTNIPNEEGISACEAAFKPIQGKTPTKKDLGELMRLILKNNNLVFGDQHYLQIHGTAMGTKMAPSFANLFMGNLEKEFLSRQNLKPQIWLRFIDDIFMIWPHGEDSLKIFVENINSFHPTIKFTADSSRVSVHFLDTTVTIENGSLKTDLFNKPTDKHNYLLPSSCHPPHCTKNIPYSQALRIKRICSSETDFEIRTNELSNHLRKRQYFRGSIENAVKKARDTPRSGTLTYKTRQPNSNRVPLVTEYHPGLPPLAKFIRKHLPILQSTARLKSIFSDPPIVAFSRPPNLRDILVRAKFQDKASVEANNENFGCSPCPANCKTCALVDSTKQFQSHQTARTFQIRQSINCLSKNVIYLIYCNICGTQYVGESKNSLRMRITQHRSAIKTKKLNQPIAFHFNLPHHSTDNLRVIAIDQNSSWNNRSRKQKEHFWIGMLQTMTPSGLNIRSDLPAL